MIVWAIISFGSPLVNLWGAGATVILGKSISGTDPGDVRYLLCLGVWSGFVIVIGGWLDHRPLYNLYRAGLAAQGYFLTTHSRKKTDMRFGPFS